MHLLHIGPLELHDNNASKQLDCISCLMMRNLHFSFLYFKWIFLKVTQLWEG